jgi:hypothetical protein
MANTRFPGIPKGQRASPSPATNAQVKPMITVSNPYKIDELGGQLVRERLIRIPCLRISFSTGDCWPVLRTGSRESSWGRRPSSSLSRTACLVFSAFLQEASLPKTALCTRRKSAAESKTSRLRTTLSSDAALSRYPLPRPLRQATPQRAMNGR